MLGASLPVPRIAHIKYPTSPFVIASSYGTQSIPGGLHTNLNIVGPFFVMLL
jgi:hypothetical protein